MKVLFMISHPAHFWMFKYTIDNLRRDGHKVVIVIRPKDVLEQLCINAGMDFYKVKNRPKKWGMFGLAIFLIEKIFEVLHIARKEKPDILIGSDGVLAVVGKLIRKPAFECYEDDAEAIALYAKMFFPIYTGVICPECCSAWKWADKKIAYPSYHELGYLHPNQFIPSREKVEAYGIDVDKPYILIRFAQLTAHHDVGIHGINTQIAERIIEMLKPHGRIYITSERPLEPQFEQYRIHINPLDMHHVMAFASLYIGDSQTMAAEAGVLGVPFVRFNDFVGRIGYLRELEDKYELGYGIHASVLADDSPIRRADGSAQPSGVEALYERVEQLVAMPAEERKATFQSRREKMLAEKIDCAQFLTWFIENYPASADETKKADEAFWKKFK